MPRFSFRSFGLLLAVAALLFAELGAEAQDGSAQTYRGRSLQAVIDEFRAAGIPLAYSDRLVPGSLRVEAEPASREPLALLREVLQPHGLALERSSNTWLVVRAAPALAPAKPGSVTVFVLTVEGTVPTDARVVLDAPAGASRRLASGVGTLADVVPGRHVVTVEAEGFLTERSVVVVAPGEAVRISMYLAPLNPRLDEVTVTASRYDLVREVAPSTAYFSRAEIESLSDFTLRCGCGPAW
jgi:hypothetical protein